MICPPRRQGNPANDLIFLYLFTRKTLISGCGEPTFGAIGINLLLTMFVQADLTSAPPPL
jgi:hypothetical protein